MYNAYDLYYFLIHVVKFYVTDIFYFNIKIGMEKSLFKKKTIRVKWSVFSYIIHI